ncbi:FXYD domain-containing ion transport regulator 3 isoform X1 [Microtus oregoni]|uniref:FXYD domain-containing ion transport regulator 3 isoform X1 n=1 Tax=Microtus oregoni TaxID=111838 RepID=UPI001BB1347E|nr:FXYD domain-containing ion transport regulator 3 isoform X1 [Microtus oregoni]
MPMTLRIKIVLSTMVESANASSDRSPVTAQGMGRLSSHQVLLTTAEDGPAEEHRAPLSPGPGFGGGLNSKMTVPTSPGTALSEPYSYLSHGSRLVVQFLI